MVVMLGSKDITINNSDIYETNRDLYLSEKVKGSCFKVIREWFKGSRQCKKTITIVWQKYGNNSFNQKNARLTKKIDVSNHCVCSLQDLGLLMKNFTILVACLMNFIQQSHKPEKFTLS